MNEVGVSFVEPTDYSAASLSKENLPTKCGSDYSKCDSSDSFESTTKKSKLPSSGQVIAAGGAVLVGGGALVKTAEKIVSGIGEFAKWAGGLFDKEVKIPQKLKGVLTLGILGAGALYVFTKALKDADGDGKSDLLEAVGKFFKPGE